MAQPNGTATMAPRPRSIDFPELKYKSEKMEAFETLQRNNVPTVLEDLLNKMCRIKPDDMYGYMSNYFRSLSNDVVISSLSILEGMDSNGGRSVEVKVYCIVCGEEKLLGKSSLPVDLFDAVLDPRKISVGKKKKGGSRGNSPSPALPTVETKPSVAASTSNSRSQKKADFMIETVKMEINKALNGISVRKYSRVDRILETLCTEAAADKTVFHRSTLLAVSCAVAEAASRLSSQPLFFHLSSARLAQAQADALLTSTNLPPCTFKVDLCEDGSKTEKPEGECKTYHLAGISPATPRERGLSLAIPPLSKSLSKYLVPFPVVATLGQGLGKLRIHEICLCPLPGFPISQQMRTLSKMHAELGKQLAAKLGATPRPLCPNGAHCHSFDKLDQVLDFIKDASVTAGLRSSTDFAVLIDIGADALYDEEKGKYELMTGQWKTTDETIAMYSDLLMHSAGTCAVLGFIDPLHPKDVTGWKKLTAKFRNKCLMVADASLRKGLPLPCCSEQSRSRQSTPSGSRLKVEETAEGEENPEGGCVEDLSCAAMTWEDTLSKTMDRADLLKGSSSHIMLTAPPSSTDNTALADLAVAAGCQFIRLGSPTGINVLLLNRLLHIHEELVSSGKLQQQFQPKLFASEAQQ